MRKNLLIISSNFCLEKGGIENTSYLFAEYFSKQMDVTTLSPSDGQIVDLPGVNSYQCKYPQRNLLYLYDSIVKVIKAHKQRKIDYALSVHFGFAFCCVFLKLFYGVPYGVLAHGEEVIKWKKGTWKESIRYTLMYPIRFLVFKYADQIFCNTEYTRGLVENITNNRNITVINPPVGLLPDLKEVTPSKAPTIVSIGRLDERKGCQNVIKAMPKVLKKFPDIKFLIAGGGGYGDTLKELTRELQLEKSVVFIGRVSEEEKCKLLSECGLFVMPSFIIPHVSVEGFGIALLEANSYGKFVLSTRSGGIPEAVEDGKTGFLVKENDVDELAEAIIRFYDPTFTYNPKDCIEWAKKRHISNIVKQYCEQINKKVK